MPTPDFVLELRRHIGHAPLWLIGVTAVVLRETEGGTEVLLARRSDNGDWTPITGIVDPGENVDEAAARETLEEAAVQIEVERLVSMYAGPVQTHHNGDLAQYLDHTFRCRWVSGEPYPADGENLETVFFALDALPPVGPIHTQRIKDALDNPATVRMHRRM